MRKIVVPLAILLAFAAFAANSRADMVFEKTYNAPGGSESFDNNSGSPAARVVNFDPGLFPGSSAILDIEVEISFSKLSDNPGTASPKYNEISFSISKPEIGPAVRLISAGTPFPLTGSFSSGDSFDPGFDGTIIFKQSAPTAVNNLTTRNKIAAGTYKPATNYDQTPAPNSSLDAFLGATGSGNYTLNIFDNAAGAPLVLKSFTVRITAVPEPTSLAFLGLFATAGAFVRRRRVR
ncbi:MAG: PEP-CTERM sorting domain-containing protein [Pirellulaceae bacterium]|jgi:hypothetical protein